MGSYLDAIAPCNQEGNRMDENTAAVRYGFCKQNCEPAWPELCTGTQQLPTTTTTAAKPQNFCDAKNKIMRCLEQINWEPSAGSVGCQLLSHLFNPADVDIFSLTNQLCFRHLLKEVFF